MRRDRSTCPRQTGVRANVFLCDRHPPPLQAEVAELLAGRDRFDPEITPKLEAYVEEQVRARGCGRARAAGAAISHVHGACRTRNQPAPARIPRCTGPQPAQGRQLRLSRPWLEVIKGSALRPEERATGRRMEGPARDDSSVGRGQVSKGTYDLEANLALLRFYQYNPATAKIPIVCKVSR